MTTSQNDTQLLEVGKQCSHPQCLLVDFLPFKCQHCTQSFCQEHYRVVDGHNCSKYDEHVHNRVAPDCPLCNEPVAVKPGQDPNDRMEQHFQTECVVVTGRIKAKSSPLCGKVTCKKVLFSPIRCDKCRGQFCPSHRFPSDHSCKAATAPVQQKAAAPRPSVPAIQANASATAKRLNVQASAKASEAVSSIKQSVAAANAAASSASKSMPFNKTDRPIALPFPVPTTTTTDTTPPMTPSTNSTLPEHHNEQPTTRPPPAIKPLSSFIPRPIFASA